MLKEVQTVLDRINEGRRRYKTWQQIVAVLGFITVFCTTYALILPAITLESSPDAICGKEEHTHTSDCYKRVPVLVCTEDHEHTDDCYVMDSVVICGKEEHKHSAACFPKEEKVVEPENPTTVAEGEEKVKDTAEVKTSDKTKASETKGSEESKASETKGSEESKASETKGSEETKASETEASETSEATETQTTLADLLEGTTLIDETSATEVTEETEPSEIEEELEEYESKTVIRRAGLLNPKMMKTESESPMQLKKTVSSKPNDDGYYTITLEAYAKGSGSIEIHTSVAPTDIVLVLDQSGSMDDTIDGTKKYKILQNAVKNFIDQVIASVKGSDGELGSDDDVAHRIAMVGFSGSNSDYTGVFLKTNKNKIKQMSAMKTNDYKNAFYNMTDDDDREDIYKAKNNIGVDAATYINLGMQMAKKIFDNNKDSTRNRLVVVFTDGVPGASRTGGWYYDPFDDQQDSGKNAEAAIATSNQLKSNYKATVYSIGIFAGADASKDGKVWNDSTWTFTEAQAADYANYFMHHLSSNLNSSGEYKNSGFYMSASKAGDLINAFETIAESVQNGGSQSTELKENTTVIDAVSDFFEFPEGGDLSNVKVYTVKSTALDGAHNPTFDNPKQVLTATVSKSSDGKSISVKGFDFSENWCGYIKEGDTYKVHPGKKMVIEIPVKPKEDFIGGYDVPTNSSDSGVYLNVDGQMKEVGKFDIPTADVAFTGKAYAASKTVYYGSEVRPVDLYFSNEGLTEGIWTKLNKYVDFIKNNGTKSGDYYEIGSTQYEIDLPDLVSSSASGPVLSTTESDSHTVKIRMRKKGTDTWSGYNVTGKIYVLVPEVTFQDVRGFYGMPYSPAKCKANNIEKSEWVPDGNWTEGSGGVPTRTGEPTYDISVDKLSATFRDFTNNVTITDDYKMYPFDVAVDVTELKADRKDGKVVDISGFTKFAWKSCTDHGDCETISSHDADADGKSEFYLHSKAGADLPATGGSGTKNWFVVGLSLMTTPIMILVSIRRKRRLINVF